MEYVRIKLSNGKFALVDKEDEMRCRKFQWSYNRGYATVTVSIKGLYESIIDDKPLFDKRFKRISVSMHRMVMGLCSDNPLEVDHINHDTLDNRKQNLRIVTRQQNAMNSRPNKGSSSKYKGVSWVKSYGRWRSGIRVKDKLKTKCFAIEKDAARYYDSLAREYHGEYAWLNTEHFPELKK